MHLDYNGKRIKIGDIVIIKNELQIREDWEDCTCPYCLNIIGSLGIIRGFGCIQVEVTDFSYNNVSTYITTFRDNDVEVVGSVN